MAQSQAEALVDGALLCCSEGPLGSGMEMAAEPWETEAHSPAPQSPAGWTHLHSHFKVKNAGILGFDDHARGQGGKQKTRPSHHHLFLPNQG